MVAFDKDDLYKRAIEIITEKGVYTVDDICAFLPCSKPTFYVYFPVDSNEFNNIKEHCNNLKSDIKAKIRAKLIQSDKAAELIALYKLVANDDERKALSMQQIEHSGQVEAKLTGFLFENDKKDTGNTDSTASA